MAGAAFWRIWIGSVPGHGARFLDWWFGQLAELLPQQLRRSAPTAADATVITPIEADGQRIEAVGVGLRRNGKESPLGQFALSASGFAELPRSAGKPAVLRLGERDVLGKTVTLPLAAERNRSGAGL